MTNASEYADAVPKGGAIVAFEIGENQIDATIVTANQKIPMELLFEKPPAYAPLKAGDHRCTGYAEIMQILNETWPSEYVKFHQCGAKDRSNRQSGAYIEWQNFLDITLRKLGTWLLSPIDKSLTKDLKLKPGAPVVLLGSGRLNILPLHAAIIDEQAMSFGDRWTVSCASAVTTLRERQRRAADPQRLLAIIDPLSLGACLEALELPKFFPGCEDTILKGPKATRETILQLLEWVTHFHASCHGKHSMDDPLNSCLRLPTGEELFVRDVQQRRLETLCLVFLSACEAGLSSEGRNPKEFVGLAVAFVGAGAICALGPLWPVLDDACYLMGMRFYEVLQSMPPTHRSPARALQKAQAWLRAVTYGELQTIFEVVHYGPKAFILIGKRRSRASDKPWCAWFAFLQKLVGQRRPEASGVSRSPSTKAAPVGAPGMRDGMGMPDEEDAGPIRYFRLPLPKDSNHKTPFGSPQEWAAFVAAGAG